jgi:hypothetical protein
VVLHMRNYSFLNLVLCSFRGPQRVQKKQISFVAGEGDCPLALSRAPGFGVHRSEAKSLDRRSGQDQAQGFVRKGIEEYCEEIRNSSVSVSLY